MAEYYPEVAAVKTGWQEENGKKFYYDDYGVKVSSWRKIGPFWYWFAVDGSMGQNTWVKDQGKWYYLQNSGAMATNQWIADNGTYWVNGSGIMVSNNWIQVSGSGTTSAATVCGQKINGFMLEIKSGTISAKAE